MESVALLRKRQIELPKDKKEEIRKILSSYAKYTEFFVDFFKKYQVADFSQIDFFLRSQFVEYLDTETVYKDKLKKALISCFDNLKLSAIKRTAYLQYDVSEYNAFFRESFFLLYYPNYEIACGYKNVSDKEESLYWNLSDLKETLANQIKVAIVYLTNGFAVKERMVKLRQLKCLMKFCQQRNISDFGKIDAAEKRQFELYEQMQEIQVASDIIDLCIYAVAKSESRFDFTRHFWCIDVCKINEIRVNKARPVKRFDFREISNSQNREYCKEYIQYLITLTDLSMKSVETKFNIIRAFCKYFAFDILQLSIREMDTYMMILEEKDMKEASFNQYVLEIRSFFSYLQKKGYKLHPDLFLTFYFKTVYTTHLERVVEEDTILKILSLLPQEDEQLSLMYRVLLETGLRISEICTMKAQCLCADERGTISQSKMKAEKLIFVTKELNEAIKAYGIARNKSAEDYLFTDKNGEAYKANTFSHKMNAFCKKYGISCKDWIFRSHDYRHNVASALYDAGVDINTIRDFLGHKSVEMTKRYIDGMEDRVERLQQDFFEEEEI